MSKLYAARKEIADGVGIPGLYAKPEEFLRMNSGQDGVSMNGIVLTEGSSEKFAGTDERYSLKGERFVPTEPKVEFHGRLGALFASRPEEDLKESVVGFVPEVLKYAGYGSLGTPQFSLAMLYTELAGRIELQRDMFVFAGVDEQDLDPSLLMWLEPEVHKVLKSWEETPEVPDPEADYEAYINFDESPIKRRDVIENRLFRESQRPNVDYRDTITDGPIFDALRKAAQLPDNQQILSATKSVDQYVNELALAAYNDKYWSHPATILQKAPADALDVSTGLLEASVPEMVAALSRLSEGYEKFSTSLSSRAIGQADLRYRMANPERGSEEFTLPTMARARAYFHAWETLLARAQKITSSSSL
jgi:hypothetical protein